MKFKERGVTVGDLLVFIIVLIVITFISVKFKSKNHKNAFIMNLQTSTSQILRS